MRITLQRVSSYLARQQSQVIISTIYSLCTPYRQNVLRQTGRDKTGFRLPPIQIIPAILKPVSDYRV